MKKNKATDSSTMENDEHKNILVDGQGYCIDKIIPKSFILNLIKRLDECYPVRAISKDKIYAEKDDIKTLPDISVWWSQLVHDWTEVKNIELLVGRHVRRFLPSATFYCGDIVFIEPNTDYMSPHLDTPYRFRKWNYSRDLLGIQVIVCLQDMDKNSASTGVVPNSHKNDFDINLCYRGHYNQYFLKNVVQPTLKISDILVYNSRLLHSCMPNTQPTVRPALLLNYLESSIIEEVSKVDNIWKSNVK